MNRIVEVPDIAVVKTIDGIKKLISLRNHKVKQRNALHDFQSGSGVKYNGDLYVLDGGIIPIIRMTSTATSVSCNVVKSRDIDVDWGDGTRETNVFTHTYTDGAEEHEIVFYGKKDALTELNCWNNQLTTLDVSQNVALTSLNCGNNPLTELDVSQNTALTALMCDGNQLTTLDVSQNVALTKLVCPRNKLASLDVSQNVALTELFCTDNQLTTLDLSQNVVLTELNCTSNQLTSLNVSQNVALTMLYLGNNQLTALDVSNNVALTMLNCYNNQLIALDVSQNVALTELFCFWNPFVTDQSALTALAESLPQREISDNAKLNIGNQTSAAWIQSICDAKNWTIE